jgi:hypothetical protein
MLMAEVPDEVVAAAQEADHAGWLAMPNEDRLPFWSRVPDDQVRRLITAAVAAERERIRRLAIQHAAYTTEDHPYQRDTLQPFADLIREP